MADEVTPAAPAPASPAAPQVQAGPWEQDIRQAFTDPQVAASVDQFLRARVQPRVTQLEQQLAEGRQAQDLWNSIHQDPVGTFQAIQAELVAAGYPVGEAQAAAAQVVQDQQQQPNPAAAAAGQQDPQQAEMYAWYQQQREAAERQAQLEAYDASIQAIVNDPANADINPNRLHTFVAAADGDFDKAIQMYRADITDVLTRYGIDPATATPVQADQAAAVAEAGRAGAPPVMGTGSAAGAGAPVPTTPDYRAEGLSPQEALHRAINDAANATFNKQAAPPVS